MGPEVLFLLLPFAALSGWWIGRRGRTAKGKTRLTFSGEYLRGLNYVLSEQPDKAIDVFLQLVEVDSETIETHFALGSLYRRRGEVDRAIRIHQNLIARPSLSVPQHNEAVLELAKDYLAAGLLDRAESLFLKLAEDKDLGLGARQQLLEIYQQEREWPKAIEMATHLGRHAKLPSKPLLAHFHCEMAEAALGSEDFPSALEEIRGALKSDPLSVRASLLEARIEASRGGFKRAIEALERVEKQDPDLIAETVEPARAIFQEAGKGAGLERFLSRLVTKYSSLAALLALSDLKKERGETQQAIDLVRQFVEKQHSFAGVARLFQLKASGHTEMRNELEAMGAILQSVQEHRPKYRCRNCGFAGKQLFWQCPGCKSWNTLKPIQMLEGE